MKFKNILILLILILIFIHSCGCSSKVDEHAYVYSGMQSEILLSNISKEEYNNGTLKLNLYDKLGHEFHNVTFGAKDIFIWYNEPKYVSFNDIEYNKNLRWQYSKIDFLFNFSIVIKSGLERSYNYLGDGYESESLAKRKSQQLFEEDKEFIKKQISIIIENIKIIYNTDIIIEQYTPVIKYD